MATERNGTQQGSAERDHGEQPFWRLAGASWRQLAGGFAQSGFSFEWHDWRAGDQPLDWARSFHPESLEICLNLKGTGTLTADGLQMRFGPETAGFFALSGGSLAAERSAAEHHEFLTVEFHLPFLRERLASHRAQLHGIVQRCLEGRGPYAAVSGVSPLTHRHRELLNSLLRPPVLASAQRLWFELKALEFAAEFFFSAGTGETLCTRAQRLAADRVSRAKAMLTTEMAEPPSLEELGRRVGCSPFYLSRTFTRETGMTISQWLRRARLEKAGELLRTGRCNVTEAAFEVGYSSLSHFSEAFHEMYGCCPGLYPLRTRSQQAASAGAKS